MHEAKTWQTCCSQALRDDGFVNEYFDIKAENPISLASRAGEFMVFVAWDTDWKEKAVAAMRLIFNRLEVDVASEHSISQSHFAALR